MKKIIFSLVLFVALLLSACSKEDNMQEKEKTKQVKKIEPKGGGIDFLATIEAPLETVKAPSDLARKFLNEKNLKVGLNDNGMYFSIGVADIGVDRDSKDFQKKRIEAYKVAMLDAKVKVAEHFARHMHKNNNVSGKFIEVPFEEFVLPDAYLELKAAKDSFSKSYFAEDQFGSIYNYIETEGMVASLLAEKFKISDGMSICGMSNFKSFEDAESVGVILYYSKNTLSYVKSISDASNNTSIRDRIEFVKDSINNYGTDLLSLHHGVVLMKDKNEGGKPILVSFGQSVLDDDSKESFAKARDSAMCNILSFLGSSINSILINSKNKISGNYAFVRLIKETFKTTEIDGVETIRTWQMKDEISNQEICGVVLVLNTKNLIK